MGLTSYFRKYITFASRTAYITELMKMGVPFVRTVKKEQGKQYVIDCLKFKPLLSILNPRLITEFHAGINLLRYEAPRPR